ncbi:fatty-acid amide hydrolase 2 [Sitodiplosis mosellana]|uniref:fatty-acid amide hydrolase 2 n=1 Tax=Sitodiplosis mosellana TaxID=263140 RepID=UPI002443A716|nr:fatty-acid amide hydrolase 2 [Sitodiplosis mosellana]XP_055317976.1 fatty-acid amide hydrolase 2 [Sitodiplosis mosellana]XP_055317978.1 fatty-acid amide hydrolase 2 [Sitodiplosis mosellana]XP_055317979.1 fatty-acid amide hydrolase 2 [Sitodiplosis mosellana]XP_055317980.1 fatty-acid amide hydrolase 2 [Sitodiplosis mosellana]XP_055317981.1 fatty-acid amide hydrolase 2 [Sitodiplosis mosellana]XP_055317982.1 fatty-acid amide hydrolase 2 [Sitodiplosis mosellana]
MTSKQQDGQHLANSKESADLQKPSIVIVALNLLHRFLCLCVRFVVVQVHGEHGPSMAPIDDLLLLESATSIAEKIRTKKITSTQVLNTFIARIKQVNPLLNCVVDERYDDALQEAAQVDELIASDKYTVDQLRETKPFLGVPISTKDCIAVKDMLHTGGLWLRRNTRATEDADSIRLMRDAGAIPFALTNVSEVCMWWESSNPVHGRSRNPYDANRIVGGSSGGEGCLLGAAGSPFGIGSDIGGSIRMPAFFNGVFGHKPSPFIVSSFGQYPIPKGKEQMSFLGVGPMSRFACDLKPMLKILAADNAKKLNLDEPVNLSNIKYFYQESDSGSYFVSPVDYDLRVAMDKVIRHLQVSLKAKPQRAKLTKLKDSVAIWLANMKDDESVSFDAQLANLNGRINPYTELFKWIFGMSKHTFIAIMTAITDRLGIQNGTPEYYEKVKERDDLRRDFEEMLGTDGVFIYPTHPTVAPYHNEPIVRPFNFSYTAIINVLGLPATAVPLGLGKKEGLPIGLQVIANRNQDRLCLAVASELERCFGGWVAPKITA